MFEPSHYYEMAEEIRSIADNMRQGERADTMRRIADDYERMGDSAKCAEAAAKVRTRERAS